jgi:chromosomal replication initiation ATPase DnaA
MNITIANAPNYYSYPGMRGTVMSRVVSQQTRLEMVGKVMIEVGEFYGVSDAEIISESRVKNKSQARMIFSYLCYNYLRLNKSQIAAILNRDHTTIIHHLKTLDDLMFTEPRLKSQVELLASKIFY